jgi:hypothetical protein
LQRCYFRFAETRLAISSTSSSSPVIDKPI